MPHVLGLALWGFIRCFGGIFLFCFPFCLGTPLTCYTLRFKYFVYCNIMRGQGKFEQNRIFMDSVLKCASFNVNGLNEPIKRKRVLTYLKKLQVDITFLQETHLMGRAGSIVIIQFKSQSSGHFDK